MRMIHRRGKDPAYSIPMTPFHAQRMRGPIQPMEQPRRLWFPFRRLGR